jgi:hypothetical protein
VRGRILVVVLHRHDARFPLLGFRV